MKRRFMVFANVLLGILAPLHGVGNCEISGWILVIASVLLLANLLMYCVCRKLGLLLISLIIYLVHVALVH